MLNRLESSPEVTIEFIDEDPLNAQQVNDNRISLALIKGVVLVTNSYNLSWVARLKGVKILTINELATAIKAAFLSGEEIPLKSIREGKESSQDVGNLEDRQWS